jgi:hypothetical protein
MSAPYDMKRVIIGVSGGVAEIMERPPDVEVEIRDFDNLEAEEKNPRTTILFWDCNCRKNYIHPKNEEMCGRCGARHDEENDDQPDAHLNEVLRLPNLPPAIRIRLLGEKELAQSEPEIHPGWMVQPPKRLCCAAFVEVGDNINGEYELEGQGDILLDEEGGVWIRTPWNADRLPEFQ